MAIKLRIREFRKRRGLSLDDLGEMNGISGGYLSELERGVKTINARRLNQLAEALKCSPAELIGHNADKEQPSFSENFERLSPENQEHIAHLIAALLKGQQ